MVASRQANNMKRKNGNKAGNVRKNFKQGQQQQQQEQSQLQQLGGGFKQQLQRNGRIAPANMGAMFNQNQIMDNPNQMMDNPGYMDFNEPPIRQTFPGHLKKQNLAANNKNGLQNGSGLQGVVKAKNRGRRVGFKQQPQHPNDNLRNNNQRINNVVGSGNIMGINSNNGRFGGAQQRNNQQNKGSSGPFRNGPMRMPPMQMPPMMPMGPMRPDFGPPQFFPQRFGSGPMMPPPQMGMPPMGRPMPRRPLPPGPMPPFRGNAGPRGAPMRRKIGGGIPIGSRRQNQKIGKNRRKVTGKGGKKPNPNPNVDKYPLDKPWVNDEIRAAHDKKVELSNQLKGKKDDQLFAEFKQQRDTFVNLYEAARLEYIGKHKEEVT